MWVRKDVINYYPITWAKVSISKKNIKRYPSIFALTNKVLSNSIAMVYILL